MLKYTRLRTKEDVLADLRMIGECIEMSILNLIDELEKNMEFIRKKEADEIISKFTDEERVKEDYHVVYDSDWQKFKEEVKAAIIENNKNIFGKVKEIIYPKSVTTENFPPFALTSWDDRSRYTKFLFERIENSEKELTGDK
jgi:hypothetical protein